MFHGLHLIWKKLFEDTSKDLRIKIRNRAHDEKGHHPCNGNPRVESIYSQRVEEGQDEEDANKTLELLPVLIVTASQTV